MQFAKKSVTELQSYRGCNTCNSVTTLYSFIFHLSSRLPTTQPEKDHTDEDKDQVDSLRAEVLLAEEHGTTGE